MSWHLPSIADGLADALRTVEDALRLEQATAGLDAREEVALQQILADGMRARFEVAREVYYPSSLARPRTQRRRCDLVLSPRDAPEAALWLEVKVAHQLRAGYGAQWRRAMVADLRKLAREPGIRDGALVLVLFNESIAIRDQHLRTFELLLAEVELLAGFCHLRSFPIVDRIGHALCSVALWPAFATSTY